MEFIRAKKIKKSIGRGFISLLLSAVLAFAAFSLSVSAEGAKERSFKYDGVKVYVGGFPFGVKFSTDGLLVVGTKNIISDGKEISPAEEAGIRAKDIITHINGSPAGTVSELCQQIEDCGGNAVDLTVTRDGKSITIKLTPKKEDGSRAYRAGLDLKDSMAGIGTVTYVKAEGGEYGSLGHGICDSATGSLMPLKKGSAIDVQIGGVIKGKSGKPGEIKGYFLSKRLGTVLSNTSCGVFGIFTDYDTNAEAVSVASRDEITEGKATIRCTLGDDGIKEYEIEISKIDKSSTDNKSFLITVTDKALKDRTGGIIQGMSGSPILQNGKLIGAVTHVLVSDPSKGYGIFIENMLDLADAAG